MDINELSSKKIIETNFNLDLHSIEIKENGCLLLSGHGELTLDTDGIYWINFFCEQSYVRNFDYISDFSFCIEEKKGSELLAILRTEKGDELVAKGFKIRQNNILGGFENDNFQFNVYSLERKETIQNRNGYYIQWEGLSKFNLIGNEYIECGHGEHKVSKRHLWTMEVPNGKFSMQRHDEGYFSFRLDSIGEESEKDFIDISSMFYSCISGRNSIPYFIEACYGDQIIKKYISNHNDIRLVNRGVSNPINHNCKSVDHNGNETDAYNFIYECLFNLKRTRPNYFDILNTAWIDMWSLDTRRLPLNIVSLVYSVTVEGILKKIYLPNLGYLEDPGYSDRKKFIRRTVNKVKELTQDERSRICQSVENWGGLGNKNILSELCRMEVIDDSEAKSWSTLRNSSAHADVTNDTDKNISDITRSLSLFNRIFFAAIGYNGGFTKFHPPIPRKNGKGTTHYTFINLPKLEIFNN